MQILAADKICARAALYCALARAHGLAQMYALKIQVKHMKKGRLEAFSDGVFAIIITIMVLELKPPQGETMGDLLEMAPTFLGYVISFAYVGIYWNNHHHMFQVVEKVDGRVLWANLFLLFWLSLMPFVTAWAGQSNFAAQPVTLYGIVLLMCAISYTILQLHLIQINGKDSAFARALGSDFKAKISLVLYIAAIALSFVNPWISCALFVVVALIWFVPDRRMEKAVESTRNAE